MQRHSAESHSIKAALIAIVLVTLGLSAAAQEPGKYANPWAAAGAALMKSLAEQDAAKRQQMLDAIVIAEHKARIEEQAARTAALKAQQQSSSATSQAASCGRREEFDQFVVGRLTLYLADARFGSRAKDLLLEAAARPLVPSKGYAPWSRTDVVWATLVGTNCSNELATVLTTGEFIGALLASQP